MLIGNKRLWGALTLCHTFPKSVLSAHLAQSVERKALNLVVVGSSPTVGVPVVNWEHSVCLRKTLGGCTRVNMVGQGVCTKEISIHNIPNNKIDIRQPLWAISADLINGGPHKARPAHRRKQTRH